MKEKCKFAQTEIKFQRHLVSKGQICMDGSKVAAIRDWPTPTKVIELRSFLGLANTITGGLFRATPRQPFCWYKIKYLYKIYFWAAGTYFID